jgi:hypothetical protein
MDHVGVMSGDPGFRWLDRVILGGDDAGRTQNPVWRP